MASSGKVTVAVTSWDDLVFEWKTSSQNVTSNTSTVAWTMKLVAGSSGRIVSSVAKNWEVTVNGTKYSGTNYINIENNATKILASGSTTITHNTDGTKSFSFSFYQQIKIDFSGVHISSKEGSGTGTLDTIARATVPSVSASSVNMGSKVTINTPRKSDKFTHLLEYAYSGGKYTTIANNVGTSYEWPTPDLASVIPSATSLTVTIRCTTYNNGTSIGSKTVTMTLKVPTTSAYMPSVSSVSVAEAAEGLAAQFGAYIKGKSAIKATIKAAGAKGSTIKKYSATFNGKTYTGSSWTSGVITAAGSLSLEVTVTDSRGRTARTTRTVTVLDYAKPSISTLEVYRVNSAGAADPNGIYLAAHYKYAVTALNNKNTASMVIEYKTSASTDWEELLTGTALSADTTIKPTSPTFSVDYQYDVRVIVTDWFDETDTYTEQLQSGAVIFDISADGLGISFGKTCERAGVETGWTLMTSGGFMPLVIPDGKDLNQVTDPNVYAGRAASAAAYENCPVTTGTSFTLEVWPAGEQGQLFQRLTTCTKGTPVVYVRHYYSGGWGSWVTL